ncbi:MAG: two-component system, LuxR family, response regulator FixJ [Rhodospirillaceae bacterium]|jgi:FixJ family two-component response regulator|nr:two-component system, LuxR family, response regulator FixJ [Rhodospirillaceae bacterium]
MPPATIFVLDDDEAVRDSLQALLETQGYGVAVYASAEDFLDAYRPARLACALVDLKMPGMDGLALLNRLAADNVRLPVIMVTGHGDIPLAVTAMKAGAVDFVEKPYSTEAILDIVRQVIGRLQQDHAGDMAASDALLRVSGLTPREREVLEQLVFGRPNKVIAHELKISPRTVEIHRANLMKKMHADSLSHLIRLALAAGAGAKPR